MRNVILHVKRAIEFSLLFMNRSSYDVPRMRVRHAENLRQDLPIACMSSSVYWSSTA